MTFDPHQQQPGRRRGFLAALSEALSPQPIPEDDSGPLIAPKGVVAATVLSVVAGAVYVFVGGLGVATIGSLMKHSQASYQQVINDCTSRFGGVGTTAITEANPTGPAATCQNLTVMSASSWDTFRTANIVVSVVFLAMGVLLILAGWFLRAGRLWARRSLVAVAVVTVLAALMLGMTSPILLGATLLLLIAVVLCYLASGATFFLRARARKHT